MCIRFCVVLVVRVVVAFHGNCLKLWFGGTLFPRAVDDAFECLVLGIGWFRDVECCTTRVKI